MQKVIHKSMLLKIWEFHRQQYPELKQTVVQPRVEQLQAYCDILDITLGELFACDASESKQRKISLSISLNVDSQEDLNRIYEAFKILGHQ